MKYKDIAIAWLQGESVQFKNDHTGEWEDLSPCEKMDFSYTFDDTIEWRLKPKFKAMKFEVGSLLHSVTIQKHLIELGYKWVGEEKGRIQHHSKPYLYTTENGEIFYGQDALTYQMSEQEPYEIFNKFCLKPSPNKLKNSEVIDFIENNFDYRKML